MTEQPTTTVFAQVLTELADSQGIEGLHGLKERLRDAGYNETADSLPDDAPGGYGEHLLKVMDLSQEEMLRISEAWAQTFLRSERLAREPEPSKIFEHIIVDLDYVASMDEEQAGETMNTLSLR